MPTYRAAPGPLGRALLVVLAVMGIGGCDTLQSILDAAPKPTASIKGVGLTDLTLESAELRFDMDIANPYSVPLPLVGMQYELACAEGRLLNGSADLSGSVPAQGTKTVQLPVRLTFAGLLSTLKQVRPGSVVPYTAQLGLSVDAPGIGRLELPLRKQGELPIPAVPEVKLTKVQWDKLSWEEAKATLNIRLKNTNQFPLDLNTITYNLALGGTPVGKVELSRSAKLPAGEAGDLELPLSIQPVKLGLAAFQLLRGEGSSYELTGAISASTPFGPIELPLSATGQTVFGK